MQNAPLTLHGLAKRIEDLEQTVNGPPHPGLDRRVTKFLDNYEAVEQERDRQQAIRHQENKDASTRLQTRISFWGAIIAFFGLLCAGCMVFLAVRAASHAETEPVKIFHSQNPAPVVALESTIPPVR